MLSRTSLAVATGALLGLGTVALYHATHREAPATRRHPLGAGWSLDDIREARAEGNRCFATGHFDAAVAAYHEAITLCGQALSYCATRAEAVVEQRLALSNLALCLIKLERFTEAVEAATSALGSGPVPSELRSKLLFRRASALTSLRKLTEALADLEAAAELTGRADPLVEGQLRKVRALLDS